MASDTPPDEFQSVNQENAMSNIYGIDDKKHQNESDGEDNEAQDMFKGRLNKKKSEESFDKSVD